MNQRIHDSNRTSSMRSGMQSSRRSRRGFTLIELLVVMGVIAILMTLTAAGVMAWMNGQARNNTTAQVRGLYAILMQHWDAVVADTKKERLWQASDVTSKPPAQYPQRVLAMADNDNERARILMIKIRLMEAFPVNYSELAFGPPGGPSSVPPGDSYATPTSGPFNPLSLIPTNRRRYRLGYQDAIFDGTTNSMRWKPAPNGKESLESAVCLYLALSTAKQGINVETDQLKAWMKDVDGSGNKVLADAWGTPLRFYRFSTNNTDLNTVAPLPPTSVGVTNALDPLDVNGKLLTLLMPTNAAGWTSANATVFDTTIHPRMYTNSTTGTQQAQYAIPVIASAGPDGRFGLPANDKNTTTFPVGSSGTSVPPTSIFAAVVNPTFSPYYMDMFYTSPTGTSTGSSADEADNIYSFKKLTGN
jgi:prepilin-type N-terminal cleavage/methylation domain-containing protein